MEVIQLLPGVTLRFFRDTRFKQGALSLQFLRPMCREESALNALLPAVLLRGTENYPDLRAITLHLDDLYGAAVGALVRRIGDYQTTGLYCGFMEDTFALPGEEILRPMVDFLEELLLRPVLEKGAFSADFVESEKKNLISTIQAEKNDKRIYASAQLLKTMCRADSFGLPRLGTAQDAEAITPEALYRHYLTVLETSHLEIFYVGSGEPQMLADLLREKFFKIGGNIQLLPPQTPFHPCEKCEKVEEMDLTQAKLCLGFLTPITNGSEDFAAMQVLNTAFGSGMTSKLFMTVREKMSLCYAISSSYYGAKGILTVSAGIDTEKESTVREEIFRQLDACRAGDITKEELEAAKEAILSSLRTVHDSPGAIENYYSTAALSGLSMTTEEYAARVSAVTTADVAAAAQTLEYHTGFFLKGGEV